ncbi:hypothetical protein QCA50_004118 [Cerrena zonata]|uniref:Cytochrome P450 n=1 Tax=Cerrena zonata TaxID=2478898 RepID=A0AAW0GQI9_9APHY
MTAVVLLLFIVLFGLWLDVRDGVHRRLKIPSSVSIFMPWYDDAIRFGLDPIGFLRRQQTQRGSTYQVRLAGRRVIVANDLDGILRIVRDTPKTLHMPDQQVLEALGGVKEHIPVTLIDRLTTYVARTFSNRTIPVFSPTFNTHLWRHIQNFTLSSPTERIPLQRFVGKALYDAVSVAIFGEHFPLDSYEEFQTVDAKMSRLFGPTIFIPRTVSEARNILKAKMGTYFEECWDDEVGVKDIPDGITQMIRSLRDAKSFIRPEDAQGAFVMFLFGLHSNTHRIVAWLFLHLLSDSRAFLRVRREIDHAIDVEFGDLETLLSAPPQRLGVSSFPLLESAIMETLRLWNAAVMIRDVLEDTEFSSDDLTPSLMAHAGDVVIGNSYAVNMSEEVFEDPDTFQVDRFVGCSAAKEEDGKSRTVPLGIFGGGTHVCKGREFALYEVKIFLILCLRLLDITAETTSGNPIDGLPLEADASRTVPSFVMYPKDEVFVRVAKRTWKTTFVSGSNL